MSETRRTASDAALIRTSWWPGLIWGVPIAALAIAVWLLARALMQGGTDVTIKFADAYGLDPKNTDILYRGMKIGSVTGVALAKDGDAVDVSANIHDDASQFLKTGTIFWLRGAKTNLSNPASLGAILSGPKIVMQPGSGDSTTHFNGLAHKPLPSARGTPVLFRVSFDGDVGELSEGDAVQVRGFPVGEVHQVDFHYDVASGRIETPVTLALYPNLFHLQGAPRAQDGDALKVALDTLITAGLRARLDREPPLIGAYQVTLEMVPGAPAADLNVTDGLPEIPTAPDGGLESIVDRVKQIPIEHIAQNVLDITKQVDEITSSPKLHDSIVELDDSLREIHAFVNDVRPKVDDIVRVLRATAMQLDQTAQEADKTLGGATAQTGFNSALHEIKEAARAVRSLADYLDRHPEALISGRNEQ